MRNAVTVFLVLTLLAASAFAEEVILEEQPGSKNISKWSRIPEATCTLLKEAPRSVKAPRDDVSAWAEVKIRENTFLVCVVSKSDNAAETTTAGLYVDTDRDRNLREEKPVILTASNKKNPLMFDFNVENLPLEFKTGRSKLKLKANVRLTHYDYGNRKLFYVYILSVYKGNTQAFKMDWEVIWVPGGEPVMQLVNGSETANHVYSGRKQIRLSMNNLKISKDKVRLKYKIQKNRKVVPVKSTKYIKTFYTTATQPTRMNIICLPNRGYIFLEPGNYSGRSATFEKEYKGDTWSLNARVSSLVVAEKGTELSQPEPLKATISARPAKGYVSLSPLLCSSMGSIAGLKKIKGEQQTPFIVVKDEKGNEVAREEARIGGTWLYSVTWRPSVEMVGKKLTAELEFEKTPFKITFEKTEFIPTAASAGNASGVAQKEKEELDPKQLSAIEKKVNAAIEKGAKFLISKQQPDGSFEGNYSRGYPLGYNALCTLTLVKCGVSLKNPAIGKAYGFLAKQDRNRTYSVGLYLMALEAKYYNKKMMQKIIDMRKKKKKKKYSTSADEQEIDEETFRPKIHPADRALAQDLVNWLVEAQLPNGCWTYSKSTGTRSGNPVRGDNSNMQYAVLGLKAGCRLGARVPANTFLKNLSYILECQGEDEGKVKRFTIPAARLKSFGGKKKKGSTSRTSSDSSDWGEETRDEYVARGWSYVHRAGTGGTAKGTGSMTTAGLTAVIICKSELIGKKVFGKKLREKTNVSIEDGCAWFAAKMNLAPSGGWYYYFMYGLERAGSLAGVRKFGTRDWYYEGVDQLLPIQKPDGSWEKYGGAVQGGAKNRAKRPLDLCQACFALLFLKRATVRVIKNLDEDQIWTGKGFLKKKTDKPAKDAKKDPGKEEKEGEKAPAEKKESEKTEEEKAPVEKKENVKEEPSKVDEIGREPEKNKEPAREESAKKENKDAEPVKK